MLLPKQQAFVNNLNSMNITVINPEAYKNMDSIIDIVCPNGHNITGSVQDLSSSRYECIECMKEHELNIEDTRGFLLALDAATYTTGYAILNRKGQLLKTGLIELNKKIPLWDRIHALTTKITELCDVYTIQVIAIEDIQYQQNAVVFKNLAMLRGVMLYNLQYKNKYTVYDNIGAEKWRSYNNIKGGDREAKKNATKIKANQIYGRDFAEDEADAIFLGKYAYYIHTESVMIEEAEELISFGADLE